jgi:exonuclease SbcC
MNVKKLAERTVVENEILQLLKLETESLDDQLGSFDDKLQKLSEINDQCRVLKEYNAIQQAVYNQEAVTLKQQQEFTTVRDAYSALEQEWFDNQARVLAAHLHDGEACPVCGSVEHPQKNDKDQTLSPSKEELEQSKYILNQVDNDYRDALAKLKATRISATIKGKKFRVRH